MMTRILLTLALTATTWAQTTHGGITSNGAVNFSGAASTRPTKTGTANPAACVVGELFYRTDTATLMHCGATDTWSAVSSGGAAVDDETVLMLREDFFSGSTGTATPNVGSTNMYTTLLASATASGAMGDQQHPGVFTAVAHATNADSGVIFNAGAPSYGYLHQDSITGNDWTFTAIVKLGSTANSRTYIGLAAGGTIAPARFIGFRYDTSSAFTDDVKGAWVAQMINGTPTDAGGSVVTLAVTPDTSWRKFQIVKAGTTYTFKVDGTSRATFCVSGCDATVTAPTSGVWPATLLAFEAGGSVTTSIDFMYFKMSGLTR